MSSIYSIIRNGNSHHSGQNHAALNKFKASVSAQTADFGKGEAQKTVNIKDLMDNGSATNSDGEPVGWNPHKVGTDEWYKFGLENGVWIGGEGFDFSAEQFLKDIDLEDSRRFENAVRTLGALADGLQKIQDEIVKLAANGASKEQIQEFAEEMLVGTAVNAGDLADQKFDDDNVNYFAQVFTFVMTGDPVEVEREFLNEITDGGSDEGRTTAGSKVVDSLAKDLDFRAVEEEIGITVFDDEARKRDLNDESVALTADLRAEIDRLPVELQAEAWKIVSAELDRAMDDAQDLELPETPEYSRGTAPSDPRRDLNGHHLGDWNRHKKEHRALIEYSLATMWG